MVVLLPRYQQLQSVVQILFLPDVKKEIVNVYLDLHSYLSLFLLTTSILAW